MSKYKTGWCGSDSHRRCGILLRNGMRAQNRYVLCSCDCHYEDSTGLDVAVAHLSAWNVEPPTRHHYGDVAEYVREINYLARPTDLESDY